MKMEGNIEINKDLIDAFRRFRDLKEGALLTNSIKHSRVTIDRYQYEYYKLDENNLNVDDLIKSEMIAEISKTIYDDIEKFVKHSDGPDGNMTYSVDFLSMPIDNFKIIVEYCIRTMPMEAINKIRENK